MAQRRAAVELTTRSKTAGDSSFRRSSRNAAIFGSGTAANNSSIRAAMRSGTRSKRVPMGQADTATTPILAGGLGPGPRRMAWPLSPEGLSLYITRRIERTGGSLLVRPYDEIEAGRIGEGPKIPVSGKKWNASIDAALGNQGIAETRHAALCQYLCP